jgi:beta-glucosidase
MTDQATAQTAPTLPALSLGPKKGMTEGEIKTAVEAVLEAATLAEKVAMMSGKGFRALFKASGRTWGADPYPAGSGCERLGVEPIYFTDGPRGVARGSSTCFPCTMARGASFDPQLEYRIGEVMGIEARAQDCTLSGAVCVNLLRHPAWGRAQETYGEDPFHLGEMGTGLATGIQAHNVMATVKHFALNSMENARFKVDIQVDERTLREVYLPHFKRIIDAGCATVMSAYNKMNGEYCGQNRELLTTILRQEWGFEGFVHSDWVRGVYRAYGASAGLDVENPEPVVFGEQLVKAVETHQIEAQVIDTACRRILTTQYRFAAAEDPLETYTTDLVACDRHRALALEAAEKSAVLLTNKNTLPLNPGAISKLAVLGRLAGLKNTGDNGSSRVKPPYVVTALEGLSDYLVGRASLIVGDEGDLDQARLAAQEADAVVVVVGYTAVEEGEYIPGDIGLEGFDANKPAEESKPQRGAVGGDRDDLGLPAAQIALIEAACATGKPVVVVVVAGSAVMMSAWADKPGAILQTFYSGMEGGNALARLLFGDVSPSGKLPFSVPQSEADFPSFDKNADTAIYGPLHGYTLLDAQGKAPAFAFGHGLSYASFAYRGLKVRRTAQALEISIGVTNTSAIDADTVVQLYVGFPGKAAPRPVKLLRGFQRLSVKAGATQIARLTVPLDTLRWWNPETRSWTLETGDHQILVGGSSNLKDLNTVVISL